MIEKDEILYIHRDELEYETFIPVPIELVKADEFRSVSAAAKLLYGFLLSRTYISNKNKIFDEKERLYVYMTLDEVMDTFKVSKSEAKNMFRELTNVGGSNIGLIERIIRPGKPSIIYVLKFSEVKDILTRGKA